ncbi:MAG: glycosyltransferase involved in cell wall biosynthesis [Saprospiraceae bacterium]|jgi:glycosyltransferase involved in cell wall biosynthesis
MIIIIQVPCFNEESTLDDVISGIPIFKQKNLFQSIAVIDDGSSDRTVEKSQELGVEQILSHKTNLGLGAAFRTGLEYAIQQRADILVNTDGDNQYPSRYIPDLIQPILDGTADIVIGNRQTSQVQHFSMFKKSMQWFGTRLVSILIGEPNIKDAVSGFRAYNRKAMLQLNVTSKFSYVLDTTIQAKMKGLRIASVDIETNPPTRPSRLFRNNFHHIRKSAMDIIRVYAMYRPMRVFFWIGIVFLLIGSYPMILFLLDYLLIGEGEGKIQSLIFGSTFIIIGVLVLALGIIADLLAKNRMLIERVLLNEKKKGHEI